MEPVAAIHTPAYLHFLENIYQRWQQIEGASEEVIANVHPNRYSSAYPNSAVGQAGWHMADTACPVGPKTWVSAWYQAENFDFWPSWPAGQSAWLFFWGPRTRPW